MTLSGTQKLARLELGSTLQKIELFGNMPMLMMQGMQNGLAMILSLDIEEESINQKESLNLSSPITIQ